MAYLSLALKGAQRYRKRRKNLTLVLVGAFFLVSFFLILFSSTSYYLGSYWGGHMLGYEVIRKKGTSLSFYTPPRQEELFPLKDVLPVLNSQGILGAPRLRFGAVVEPDVEELTESDMQPLMLVGIDPEREPYVLDGLSLEWGRWPSGPGEIVVFQSVYDLLAGGKGLWEGAGTEETAQPLDLVLYTSTLDGYFNYDLVRVVGVVIPHDLQFFYGDRGVGFVERSYAASLIGAQEGYVSEVVTGRLSWWQRLKLSALLPSEYERVGFWKMEEIPYTFRWFYRFLSVLLFLLILGVVFATVSHNIRLLVASRMKEIGVYLSMGASPVWVVGLFVCELVFYVAYCTLVGGVLNAGLLMLLNRAGIYAINAPMELFLGTGTFFFRISFGKYVLSFVILLGVVLIATLRPLIGALRRIDVISLFRG